VTAPEHHTVADNVRSLFPGYFAMVMATGIIAVGAAQQDLTWLGDGLYLIAAVTYVTLAVLLIWRLLIASRLLAADITSHTKGFAFLTTVAATNVLGSVANVTAYNTGLKYYTVAVSGNTATGYTLTATRKGDLANDPKCGNFTLTMSAGVVTPNVSTGDVNYCWRK